VTVSTSNNAWAVGFGRSRASVERWDGTSWNFVFNPAVSGVRGVRAGKLLCCDSLSEFS
jgi:hypothetical protein